MDLFGQRRPNRKELARVKSWATELLDLGPDDSLTANELACDKPDCPPHETVILIARSGEATVQAKVPKPAVEIDRSDLQRALEKKGLIPQ